MDANQRLAALERRLAEIEAFLERQGLHVDHAQGQPVQPSEAPSVGKTAVTGATVVADATAQASESPNPLIEMLARQKAQGRPRAEPASPLFDEAAPRSTASRPPPLPRRSDAAGVEQTLGLKVAGWFGAIVLVIGAALGVKYAYDQRWLGGLPDAVKVGLLYTLGAIVIGLGEWVYRRVNRVAAVGLYATGVALLFVVSYAGSGYFQLYDQSMAFALMAGSCAVGAIIALRGGLVSIAVLSLLGANVAPFVLRDRTVGEMPLLGYVLALQLMAVTLAQLGKGDRWWVLRTLSLVLTNLWLAGRLVNPATASSTVTLAFACIYYLVFQFENTLAARRAEGRDADRFSYSSFSLATTSVFGVTLLSWARVWEPMPRAGLLVALGMALATAGMTLISSPRVALRSVASSWLVQAGLLLFVALAVALSGPALVFAWAGLGLAYGVLGLVTGRVRTTMAGVAVWFVAAGYAVARALAMPLLASSVWFDIGPLSVTAFLGTTLAVGLIGHALSMLVHRAHVRTATGEKPQVNPLRDVVRPVAAALSVSALGLMLVGMWVAWPPLTVTVGWIVLGWFCIALWRASGRSVYAVMGMVVAGAALAKWAVIDVLRERTGLQVDLADRAVLFNPMMLVGLIAAASAWVTTRVTRRVLNQEGSLAGGLAMLAGVIALTIGLSVEVERGVAWVVVHRGTSWPPAQLAHFGWSVLWAGMALLCLPVARMLGDDSTRQKAIQCASLVVGACAAKFLVLDSLYFALSGSRVEATVLINPHVLTCVGVLAFIGFVLRFALAERLYSTLRVIALMLPLVVGTIELDRQLGPERTQVSWSVFWGVYAVLAIGLGFWIRSAACRFIGLGLLGLTLVKIVLVDLANAGQGWRILSFVGVGTILLLTSVLYGKLAPGVKRENASPPE